MASKPGPEKSSASDNAMQRRRSDGAGDGGQRPPKRPRKQRPCLSCEECRRLKMKCDRKLPCSNCVRRHRDAYCNAAAATREGNGQHVEEHSQPYAVIGGGERSQPSLNPSLNTVSPSAGLHQQMQQGREARVSDLVQYQLRTQAYASQSSPQHTSTADPLDRRAASSYSVPTRAQGSAMTASQLIDDGASGSFGTLMLSKGGGSKYLGPTAGSEWLKDSETQGILESPSETRPPSPDISQDPSRLQQDKSTFDTTPIAFPFNASATRIRTKDLLARLPPRDEAWTLIESYYRYCAWHHDVAPKPAFEKTFDRVYTLSEQGSVFPPIDPQDIALVFIMLAQGTMFNIEMPNNDPSAEEWLYLSEQALVKGKFLSNNLVAGLQTLHLMAHLHWHIDKGQRGDNAWPLWGLVMRLIQAMGMHRDGTRWNLPKDVVEERRKVFWECSAADTFQAHCFSRPCAINPEHCDTEFPSEPLSSRGDESYYRLRFKLSQLSSEILNMAMKVRKPTYSSVTDVHLRLQEFERNLPFSLRCRAALLAMPSQFPHIEAAIEASPEPSRRSMTSSFQQSNLALNISETMINLHRPYYAKALYEDIEDGTRSLYAPSFLAVVERCGIIIALVTDIHARFPAVSTRQWSFWHHVFNSALCLGTLLFRDPGNDMASYVIAQIDAAIRLFASLNQHGANSPRYSRNLQWLSKLRARISSKVSAGANAQKSNQQEDNDITTRRSSLAGEDGEEVDSLGWRTRLIERAGQHHQSIRAISLPSNPASPQITLDSNRSLSQNYIGRPEITMADSTAPFVTPDSTNELLHEFWDPLLLQDIFGAPQDQSNSLTNNAMAWWEDPTNIPNSLHTIL